MATPAPKKRRVMEDNRWPSGNETAESTTATGLKLLESLKSSRDKTGRIVATEFLQLPPRTNTEYYRQVKLPLSFQEIEDKLNALQYENMTALESDLKRMVQNAKEFNTTSSKIYEDAERIRKALSNFMPKHNPAYKDQEYRAVPTPIPDDIEDKGHVYQATSSVDALVAPTIKLRVNGSASRKSANGEKDQTPSAGMESIQQEQVKIVEEMIELRDPTDADTEITLEFYEKPSRRDYPDYYKQISHPTALKDIQRAVSNNKFPTWESFITEIEYLWENARTYNEEGSFIHENANKLRDWFLNRLSGIDGARDIMPPRKLILNPPKNPSQQPTPRIKFTNLNKDITQPGITVDEEARRRQDEHVRAASRGQVFSSNETPVRMAQRPSGRRESPRADKVESGLKRSASVVSVGGVEDKGTLAQDSSMADAPPHSDQPAQPPDNPKPSQDVASTASMQPPASIPQQSQPPQVPRPPIATPAYLVETAFDRVMRDPGKGIKDALYTHIEAVTDPELEHPHPWKMTFFPEETQTQHGMVIHLAPSQLWLRMTLHLSQECLSRAQWRPVLSQDLAIVFPIQPTVRGVYTFQLRLLPGVNTICADFLATINKKGEPALEWPQERHDFERFVLTVNLLAQEV